MYEKKLFEKYKEGRHWEKHPIIYAEKFLNFLKEKNFSGLIVDIGCGDGRDVNVFSKSGYDAIGLDYSKKEINNAKKKYPSHLFQVQNVESLNFEDGSVDAFFMINVIHYVDKNKAIKEIFRTLKPAGYLFIHFNIDIIDKKGNADYHQDLEEILHLISKFKIMQKIIFERTDETPVEHKHKIAEFILQKPK